MKKLISILLIVVMAFTLMPLTMTASAETELLDSSVMFDDIDKTKWYKEAVDYAVTNNLFQGTSDSLFEPNAPMNRAMFVMVLSRIEGVIVSNNIYTSFKDVPSGKWYTGVVNWAANNDIVNGMSANTFEPMTSITREQMCTILVRYAKGKNITLSDNAENKLFSDDSKISTWAYDAVYACKKAGLVNGVTATTFEPKSTATRAQVAKILMGFHRDYIQNGSGNGNESGNDKEDIDDNTAEQSKYNLENNPFLKDRITVNKSALPSFDIDDTAFVRAGTKLADLKGKTLVFFTPNNQASWDYKDASGKIVDEWTWFKNLKSELGLNVKYTVKTNMSSASSALQAMNAGKQCDIIQTDSSNFMAGIAISRNLGGLININDNESAPGISKKVMDICKWGNTKRVIAPKGNVDVLWYNETMSDDLGLVNPYTTWKNGNWNWNTFKSYLLSAPSHIGGVDLYAFGYKTTLLPHAWSATNGSPSFVLKADAGVPTIINNWDNPSTVEAWEFITTVCNSVNVDVQGLSTKSSAYHRLFEGTALMITTTDPMTYENTEYSKRIRINWVPYPKSNTSDGKEICQYSGIGMMLPKKTVKEDNVNVALKFMELWATRYSEAIRDGLKNYEYFSFSDTRIKEYFNYCNKNTTFTLCMNNFVDSDFWNYSKFFRAFDGTATYNVRTEAAKASNLVSNYIIQCLKFGQ